MNRLSHAWARFMELPWLARRAAIAVVSYVVAMSGFAVYAAGLQQAGQVLLFVGSVTFAWSIGFLYVLRGAFFIFVWWLRIFR